MENLQTIASHYLIRFAEQNRASLTAMWPEIDMTAAAEVDEALLDIRMTASKGQAIADAYDALVHTPDDPLTIASYKRLAGEMYVQYLHMTETCGIAIEPYFGEGEPYENSEAMRADVRDNGHLNFLATTTGSFGSGPVADRPGWMLMPTHIRIGDYTLLINDIFRSVHDFFGHAVPGTGFGPTGEERAWYCHSLMCTPLARIALTTETRGQNCWVNYGPHMRDEAGNLRADSDPLWLSPPRRPFAPQKNAILPGWISGVSLSEKDRQIAISTSLPSARTEPRPGCFHRAA